MRTLRLAPLWIALLAACVAAGAEGAEPEGTYGLYFGAPGGAVTVPEPPITADAPGLTVELRFKALVKLSATVPVIARGVPTAKDAERGSFCLSLGAADLALDLQDATGKTKTVRAHGAWKEGVWHHLVATMSGKEAVLYVDGKRVGGGKLDGFGTLPGSKLPLVIGTLPDPKGKSKVCFSGFLSDVAIWKEARGADAIATAGGAPLTGNEPELAAFYPLRQRAPGATIQGLPSGAPVGEVSPALACAGWCPTPWWFEERPDRPWVHLFSYDLTATSGMGPQDRLILVANPARGEAGVLWQSEATRQVRVTWVTPSLEENRTVTLRGMEGGMLAAGTADPQGNVYYMMIEPSNGRNDTTLATRLYMASAEGETSVDASAEGLNVTDYGGRWVGSMAFSKDALCMILPRRMHRSEDTLQHQGGVAATFGADLAPFQVLGQTSGHSFGNLLTVDSRGEFIGLDLGDNFPRGLNMHRIAKGSLESSVIFTYKTAHATKPGEDYPAYPEISGNGRTYYKWSNDNNTYSELGGVVEGKTCFVVVFSTDRSPEGKVLDCSRVGVENEPRDLCLLRIVKTFARGGGPQVNDTLMAGLPKGAQAETGGYYDFTGKWVPQRVTGALWLTSHAPGEAAHAPQIARRSDGTILILWEWSGPGGRSLRATTVDESGKKLAEVDGLGAGLRLVPEGVPLRLRDRIFTLALDGAGSARLCFVRDE